MNLDEIFDDVFVSELEARYFAEINYLRDNFPTLYCQLANGKAEAYKP